MQMYQIPEQCVNTDTAQQFLESIVYFPLKLVDGSMTPVCHLAELMGQPGVQQVLTPLPMCSPMRPVPPPALSPPVP